MGFDGSLRLELSYATSDLNAAEVKSGGVWRPAALSHGVSFEHLVQVPSDVSTAVTGFFLLPPINL